MGRWSLGSNMGLHQCKIKGLKKVHGEFGYVGVERGARKKWMGSARSLQIHLVFQYQSC